MVEAFAKRPSLTYFCACPVECKAYFSGGVNIFVFLEREQTFSFFKGLMVFFAAKQI